MYTYLYNVATYPAYIPDEDRCEHGVSAVRCSVLQHCHPALETAMIVEAVATLTVMAVTTAKAKPVF